MQASPLIQAFEDDAIKAVRLRLSETERCATAAFAGLRRNLPDALYSTSVFYCGRRNQIADFARRNGLPLIGFARQDAEAGALLAYGPNLDDLYRRAGEYVDRILKGAKPGDSPVERPARFDLVLNLKTAKALGLTIPESVRLRATDVVE